MMKSKSSTSLTTRSFIRPLPLLVALVAITVIGCTEEEPPGQGNNDVGPTVDAGPDDVDDDDVDDDADAGPDDDADGGEEPEVTCDDIDCAAGEQCYHAGCYPTCDSDLDCADGLICNTGRCVDPDCGDVECNHGYSCYRGRCYDECERSPDCGEVGAGITCRDNACVPLDAQCEDLECHLAQCPEGETTTVTGIVTTPSGDYPLPGATVYVPTEDLDPLPQGAECTTCDQLLSGDPFIQNITDVEGKFELPNFPVADEVPLVVQTGTWRREVTLEDIQPCEVNELDVEDTRLPRNQSEGNIPKIAVTDGSCDSLECLPLLIGLDEDEFTGPGGSGSVHLFDGGGSGNFDSGDNYGDGPSWWDDAASMMEYEVWLSSCDCTTATGNKNQMSYLSMEHFLNEGGRAFLSHYEYVWLEEGTPNLQSVAEWEGPFSVENQVEVDTSHADGQEFRDWLDLVGAIDSNNQMSITQPRGHISWVDDVLTEVWLFHPNSYLDDGDNRPNYFSFNMPLGTEGDDACGRAVFSNLHVDSSISSFPSGCSTSLTGQQEALVYMLFDLSACIAPECEPITCDDVKGQCGIHPDECGGIIECGECCAPLDGDCTEDGDCCGDLTCHTDTNTCIYED